jgi:cytoskeletal protein RodZ
MTTRDQARRTAADLRAEPARTQPQPEPAPALPERLYAARERKGVDLYRAERDTKIRARYLAALERGDWKELPGAVYTKGFLRNYALYLGLEPEDVLRQWRRERGEVREAAEPIVVPRPISAPRQGLTFSPGIIWAAILTVGVIAFAIYLGVQLLRFAKPPTLSVTNPSTAVTEVTESTTTYTIQGTTIPGATVSISIAGREQPYRVSAAEDGRWSQQVELRRGQNQFEVTAVDPETGKQAENPVLVLIRVPFLVFEAPTLQLDQPAEGATFENGAIPVQGVTANATKVVVSAKYLGPVVKSTGAAPTLPPAERPKDVSINVGDDGRFSTPFDLTAGRWTLTVTASSDQGKTISLQRNVTVAYKGVNLVVSIKGGRAWLKVWVDGKVATPPGQGGDTYSSGDTLTLTAKQSIEVRTGSAGVTYFTLNGISLGTLGKSGVPETWLFEPPKQPQKTQRR